VTAAFLVATLSLRDSHHKWAVQEASENSPSWYTCEAVLSEACHLLGERGMPALNAMLSRRAVIASFNLDDNVESVVAFLQKYASVPMSFADACLVRMSEIMADPLIVTTDSDFHVYRRHSRQVVPVLYPR
jgi:predicted nucleic acid-binding protein